MRATAVLLLALVSGCGATNGTGTSTVSTHVSLYAGVGYYDTWGWGPCCYYVPPPPGAHPVPPPGGAGAPRPTHPIATPPPAAARPPMAAPRPAMRGGRR